MASKVIIKDNNLLLDKTEGKGMKVDLVTPTYGWKDLIGTVSPDPAGVGSPALSAFRGGNIRVYAYNVADLLDAYFHIPHDYAPGTDIFVHVHWSHNGTAISGNNIMDLSYSYAKGHNQGSFAVEKAQQIIYNTVDIATTPQYIHRIDEIQLSDNGGTGNFLDTNEIEVDGIILISLEQNTIPAITGGSPNNPFIFTMDLHYQSTNAPTKQKAPNFYI